MNNNFNHSEKNFENLTPEQQIQDVCYALWLLEINSDQKLLEDKAEYISLLASSFMERDMVAAHLAYILDNFELNSISRKAFQLAKKQF